VCMPCKQAMPNARTALAPKQIYCASQKAKFY
jgi:hypothetical protein